MPPAADAKEGLLDSIDDTAAPAVTGEGTVDTPESFDAELRTEDKALEAETKPKTDTRPEGYVTKGERDRIAGELHAERQARAQAEDRFAKMVDRFYKDNAPEPAAEDLGPDPEVDPVGALSWTRNQLLSRQKAEQEARQNWQNQTQAQQQETTAISEVQQYWNRVAATKPELNDTANALRASIGKEMVEVWGLTVEQAIAEVERQEKAIILHARRHQLPIDRVIENMAANRGVKPNAPQPSAEQKPIPDRDPATGQFVATEAEKAAKIAQSQERNTSLGSVTGAPVKKMTPAELAKMSEEDMWRHFDGMKGQKGSKQFDREMGFRS